jgi:hypothetical protein
MGGGYGAACGVVLEEEEREVLGRWARRPKSSQALALRCRIVLAAAEGWSSKRGANHSVRDLVASIRTCITNWNDDPKPFVWPKTADHILDSLVAYCQRINDSGH